MMEEVFSLFGLSRSSRLALAAGFFSAGALIQILLPWGVLPGFFVIALGWFPLLLRNVTNKPADQGLEEWRPVSMKEVDRLADTLRESKAQRLKSGGAMAGTLILSLVLGFAAVISLAFSRSAAVILADTLLFLIPGLYFGRVKVFVPKLLDQKMSCFQAVFSEASGSEFTITPYLRFDKDTEGRDVPEDMRLMLEPKRKADDFVGVQFQAAINKGPNGEVPYLYAVFLTSGKGRSYRALSSVSAKGYHVEAGGDDRYGSIVVRQHTSGSGYTTKPSDCGRLFEVVGLMLEKAGL